MLSVTVSRAAWENTLRAGWVRAGANPPWAGVGPWFQTQEVQGSPVWPSDVGPRDVSLQGWVLLLLPHSIQATDFCSST